MDRIVLMLLYMFLLALTAGMTGCKKMVQLPDRDGQPNSGVYFANDQQAVDAINGLRVRTMQETGSFTNGANTVFPGLSGDELKPTGSAKYLEDFAGNRLSSDNTYVAAIYNTAYGIIANINIVLQGLGGASIPDALRARLQGECYCLRALIYSRLAGLFGNVPLVTSTNVDVVARLPRSPVAAVYDQVLADLLAADSLLPAEYVAGDKDVVARTSPDRWTARGLLARIYLYLERWPQAERMATDVLGRDELTLEHNPDSVFLSGSHEIMWQLLPASQGVNGEATYFLPANGTRPAFAILPSLLNAFEPGDRRKTAWTATHSSGVVYPFKYKMRTGSEGKECNVLLRLAEQYLIRAEARAHEDELTGAIADLNTVRQRAGLPVLKNNLSQQEVLAAVAQERRIELMCEWGHRWIDIKRTGQADALMSVLKTAWKPTAALYPLPVGELKKDPFLIQNPGY
ncbi:MAG TPA: RagB/SusD family nutrient uptake outer membrane protein [Puia sp.]|nr:RagB/SusD family nutrient uptake outer membrane protein [Puia sp.]